VIGYLLATVIYVWGLFQGHETMMEASAIALFTIATQIYLNLSDLAKTLKGK
jgi:hypothetical protein